MSNIINKQKLFFISLIGIVVISLMLMTTFAYQSLQTEYKSGSNKDVVVNSGVLDVSFTVSNRINNANMKLYSSYKASDYSEFSIDNTKSNADALYKIKLVDMEYTDNLKTSEFKYTILDADNNVVLKEGDFSSLNSTEIELTEYNPIEKEKTKKIRLYLWLKETNENQNNLKNAAFKGKIEINSIFDDLLRNVLINSAKNASTAKDTIRTTYNSGTTKVAEEISTESEKTLSVAEDDYGDSYYYRGNVVDNYVNFAGMCWRVVRIAGDGTVKLILEDQDEECSETMDGNWDIPTETGGTIKSGNFGYTYYSSESLVTSNGITNSKAITLNNYLNGESNKDLAMAYIFKNYQIKLNTKIQTVYPDKSLSDYLKEGDWCLNDLAYSSSNDNTTLLTKNEILDKKINGIQIYYNSYIRLKGKTTKEPTLKCNGTNMNKFSDNTDMYIGTLTADEVIYAGSKIETNNSDYYLINDYQKYNTLHFWSISISTFITDHDRALRIDNTGSISGNYVGDANALRPSISLLSNVEIISGDGTKANAYVVK